MHQLVGLSSRREQGQTSGAPSWGCYFLCYSVLWFFVIVLCCYLRGLFLCISGLIFLGNKIFHLWQCVFNKHVFIRSIFCVETQVELSGALSQPPLQPLPKGSDTQVELSGALSQPSKLEPKSQESRGGGEPRNYDFI